MTKDRLAALQAVSQRNSRHKTRQSYKFRVQVPFFCKRRIDKSESMNLAHFPRVDQ